jgi:hypothetical protein
VASVHPELEKPELIQAVQVPTDLVQQELTQLGLAAAPAGVTAPVVPPVDPPVNLSSLPEILPAQPVLDSIAALVPEAMLRVQKCASCGFPVSEGRALCLDCERRNDSEKKELEKQRKKGVAEAKPDNPEQGPSAEAALPTSGEFVPAFLANATPVYESWLSNHVNLLAIAVLILCILVAVVVFR